MIRILVVSASLFIMSCARTVIYPLGTHPMDRISDNYYIKDTNNHHDDIVGTWFWESGETSFELVLEEFEMDSDFLQPTTFVDRVFGRYSYIVDGSVISQINSIAGLPNFKVALIFDTPTKYNVIIHDVVSERSKVGEFILTSSNSATLNLWDSNGIKINHGNGQDFALPTNLVLTKQ